jgi:hypothetical protein
VVSLTIKDKYKLPKAYNNDFHNLNHMQLMNYKFKPQNDLELLISQWN